LSAVQRADAPQSRGLSAERLPRDEQARSEERDHSRGDRAREQMDEEHGRSMGGVERLQGVGRPKMDGRVGSKVDGWLDGWVSGCSPRGGSSAVGPSPTGGAYGPLSSVGPVYGGGGGASSSAPLDAHNSGGSLGSMLAAGLVERIDIPAPSAPSPNLSPVGHQVCASDGTGPLYSSLATVESNSGCSSNSSSSSNESDSQKRPPPNDRARRSPRPAQQSGSGVGPTSVSRGASTISCMPNWPLIMLLRGKVRQ